MYKKLKNPGRKAAAAAVVVGLASAAMAFGVATSASAATGGSNEGIRNVQLVPDAPATSFGPGGTYGTLRYNQGDGSPTGTYSLATGDVRRTAFRLPNGLVFVPNACDGINNAVVSGRLNQCGLSEGGHLLTWTETATAPAGPLTIDYNALNMSFGIMSNGLISGNVTGEYVPWSGITTQTPLVTVPQSAIPGANTAFAATGATGPVNGNYTLTGTAQPGASITVKDADGDVVGTATADANGNWSAQIPVDGTNPPLSITQSVGGQVSPPISFNTAPLPVMNGVVAAGAIALAGLGFGGYRLLRRSRVIA